MSKKYSSVRLYDESKRKLMSRAKMKGMTLIQYMQKMADEDDFNEIMFKW